MWPHHFQTTSAAAFAATLSGIALLAGSIGPARAVTFEAVKGPSASSVPALNNAGDTAFLSGNSLVKESDGTFTFVARSNFFGNEFGDFVPTLNDRGDTAFTELNRIYKETDGALSLVARQGDIAPGTGGALFDNGSDGDILFSFGQTAMNNRGDVAFRSAFVEHGVRGGDGIFKETDGVLGLVASSPSSNSFQDPVINDHGNVAFVGGRGTVYKERNGVLGVVAREGETAPGTGGATFGTIDPRVLPTACCVDLNNNGDVAFRSFLGGDGVNSGDDTAIFRESNGMLDLVVREGDAAPGVDGAVFSAFYGMGINDGGDIAFAANLTGSGVDFRTDEALYFAPGSGGALQLVIREGDLLDLGEGKSQLLSEIDTGVLGFLQLNNAGTVVFKSGAGIFLARGILAADPIAPVPLPGSLIFLGTAVLFGGGLAARRRRAAAGGAE